uniref:Uncharacterized protein n=1 Tax=viral metagenome TaxID=1070528 RepID=A0A2V0RHQ3_9ZZZZ
MQQLAISGHGPFLKKHKNATTLKITMPGFVDERAPTKVGEHLLSLANGGDFSSYHPVYKSLTGTPMDGLSVSEMRLVGGMPAAATTDDVAAILVPLSPFDRAEALVGRSGHGWTSKGFTVIANSGRDAAATLESGSRIKSVMAILRNAAADDDCVGSWKTGILAPFRGTETTLSAGAPTSAYAAGNYNEIHVDGLPAILEAGSLPSQSGPLRDHRQITMVTPYHLDYLYEPERYSFAVGETYARPMMAFYLSGLNQATYEGLSVEVIYYGTKVPSVGAASVLGYAQGTVPDDELMRIRYEPVHSFGR